MTEERKSRLRGPTSGFDPGCVKTCTSQECAELFDARPPAGSSSTTGKNERIRKERHEIWEMAEAATRYWRLRLDFEYAVSWAQQMEVPEGSFHPAVNPGDRPRNVERYRASLVKQLLTPARMVRRSSGNKRR